MHFHDKLMDLYIYYRAACSDADELQQRVLAMQSALSKEHGISAGLKRRPETKDGRHTWMEIYNSVPDGFDAILTQAVSQAKLLSFIDGDRHTEYFLDVSCA